jgi:lipopolysaccharide transport system ATP-binding protein
MFEWDQATATWLRIICSFLLVDEVMAMGDMQFQKKCLGKIGEVSREEGRTVLFVSHNMSAINSLCAKGIYLDVGRLKQVSDTKTVVYKYLSSGAIESNGEKVFKEIRGKNQKAVFFTVVSILDHKRNVWDSLYQDSSDVSHARPVFCYNCRSHAFG